MPSTGRAPRPSPPSRSRLERTVPASPRSTAPGKGSWRRTLRPDAAAGLGDPGAHLAGADDEDAWDQHDVEPTRTQREEGQGTAVAFLGAFA